MDLIIEKFILSLYYVSIITNSVLDLALCLLSVPTDPPPHIPPDKEMVLVYPPVLIIAAWVREVVIVSRPQQGENILLTPWEYLTS